MANSSFGAEDRGFFGPFSTGEHLLLQIFSWVLTCLAFSNALSLFATLFLFYIFIFLFNFFYLIFIYFATFSFISFSSISFSLPESSWRRKNEGVVLSHRIEVASVINWRGGSFFSSNLPSLHWYSSNWNGLSCCLSFDFCCCVSLWFCLLFCLCHVLRSFFPLLLFVIFFFPSCAFFQVLISLSFERQGNSHWGLCQEGVLFIIMIIAIMIILIIIVKGDSHWGLCREVFRSQLSESALGRAQQNWNKYNEYHIMPYHYNYVRMIIKSCN